MASPSALLQNLTWESFIKAKDLHRRIFFTLWIFIVYRLGTYVPLPGINPVAMKALAKQYNNGFLSMFNLVTGGGLERMSVFALNLMPYISSSIIIQLLGALVPHFMALKKEGESGRRKLNQYTRYGTIALASVQSIGLASMLSTQPGLIFDPGIFFYLSMI